MKLVDRGQLAVRVARSVVGDTRKDGLGDEPFQAPLVLTAVNFMAGGSSLPCPASCLVVVRSGTQRRQTLTMVNATRHFLDVGSGPQNP